MAKNTVNSARHSAPRSRRRRRSGVPVMLTIILIIIALLMGALAGYAVARKTNPYLHDLQAAKDRVMELENTLTLIGYPVEDAEADPEEWLYDNNAEQNALAELTGDTWDDDESDVWSEETLLSGTLPEDGEPVVVAEFDGGELLSSEVIPAYNDRLTTQIFAGHDADEVAEETLNRVLEEQAGDKIIAARARQLGLTELTDEDLAQIEAKAAENYEGQLNDFMAFVGGTDREAAAQQLAEEGGITLESITEQLKQTWWTQKFYDYTVKDVTVTDEEVQACYTDLLSRQKEAFAATPEDFEYAHLNGSAIVWRPEGYRAVRDILIPFDTETDAAAAERLLDDLDMIDEDPEALASTQAALDALYAPLEKKAEAVQQKLADGGDFAALMDEYGTSEALQSEPLLSEGYYITDNSFVNSMEYVEGSMMLEQPGQVSAPLRSAQGVHLVQYVGDVTPGEVPLSEVEDAVRAEALSQKQADYYAEQRKALLEEAHVKYYPERLH